MYTPAVQLFDQFWQEQVMNAKGLRRKRLMEGPGYAEKLFGVDIWLPAFGNFNNLTAEFQVHDYRDGYRYIDYVWRSGQHRVQSS